MELVIVNISRNFISLSLILLSILCTVLPLPVTNNHKAKEDHLYKFAYLDSDLTDSKFILALKKYQQEPKHGTGKPRCGIVDVHSGLEQRRMKRFGKFLDLNLVPHRLVWPHSILTWKLEDPYNLLDAYDSYIVRNTLHRAFNDWSEASRRSLQFEEKTETNETTNFLVLFANGPHNDSLPFDGQGGVVAHGFYPMDGNLHFDASEKWTLNLDDGINLYQTAVHEIGHLLGLEHSSDYKSVMFPINRPYDPYYHLGDDDVRGIRYLYAPWAWSYYFNNDVRKLKRRKDNPRIKIR